MGGDGGLSAVQSAINDFLNSPEALNQSEGVALSDVRSPCRLIMGCIAPVSAPESRCTLHDSEPFSYSHSSVLALPKREDATQGRFGA